MKRLLLLLAAAPMVALSVLATPGDIYEADFGGNFVFKITPQGTVSVFASGIPAPSGLTFDVQGNLFVSSFGSGRIFKITPDGTRTIFATGLQNPFGLVFDSAGNLYEADRSGTIFKFTPAGVKTTFATGLNIPAGLAFDTGGKLFEANFGDGKILTFNPAPATFATGLMSPDALVFMKDGSLLVTSAPGTIIKFTADGMQTTFATGFNQPTGLVFDPSGNLYVSDNAAGTITKIAPNGTKSTFAQGFSNPQELAIEPTQTGQLLNISSRLRVQTGDNGLFAGFILTGPDPKKVIIRALGPSLTANGGPIPGRLTDTTLELHDQTGAVIATNDNWKVRDSDGTSQQAEIEATTIPPTNDLESAIITTLPANSAGYTAIVRGKGDTTGIGLVDAYDLAQSANSKLANISTRGFVDTGDNVLIGGFIVGGGGNAKVIVRGLGPSLLANGGPIPGRLADTTLELHDQNGAILATNDNWKVRDSDGTSQQAEIEATTIPPTNDLESALIAILPAGNATAIVRGKGNTTGVGVVEVYNIQ